jgi:hypothetical protein
MVTIYKIIKRDVPFNIPLNYIWRYFGNGVPLMILSGKIPGTFTGSLYFAGKVKNGLTPGIEDHRPR